MNEKKVNITVCVIDQRGTYKGHFAGGPWCWVRIKCGLGVNYPTSTVSGAADMSASRFSSIASRDNLNVVKILEYGDNIENPDGRSLFADESWKVARAVSHYAE